jgi:hypothetical protein
MDRPGVPHLTAWMRMIGRVLCTRGAFILSAVALMAAVMAWAPAMEAKTPPKKAAKAPAKEQQPALSKEEKKALKQEKKGALPSCYRCKFQKDLEKEIADNEAARDIYKRQAEHWKKEIEGTKSAIGRYPSSRRDSDLETYLNGGKEERMESFKKETKHKGVISLDTNPITCESDVAPAADPKAEKARKKKIAQFKAATMCCQVLEWSMEHELDHVKACEARNKENKMPTAEDLANEEADEHQKQIDKLKDLLARAKDHCTNKEPTMQKYDEFCEQSMVMRIQDATERLSRVAAAVKQSKKSGKPRK